MAFEKEGKSRDVGSLIKAQRKTRDMTQKELAELTGLKRSTIAQIETGKIRPSRENLLKISAKLDSRLPIETKGSNNEEQENKINNLVARFSLLAHRDLELAWSFLRDAEQAEDARENGDRTMFDLVEERRRHFYSLYSGVLMGTINLKEFSTIETWSGLLEKAEKSIWATSCLKPETWWLTPIGKYYHTINIEKIKKMKERSKEFEIQRIFVFENSQEYEQIKYLIKEQLKAGTKIWIGYRRKLPPGLANDFYIIDDNKYVGWLDIRNREMIENTRFSKDPYEISRARQMFKNMKSLCKEINSLEKLEKRKGQKGAG